MMFLGFVRYGVRGFGRGVGMLMLRLAPVSGFPRVYRAATTPKPVGFRKQATPANQANAGQQARAHRAP
ncbi:hypothetical protein [Microbacterium paraoxydans]|uniref:hypothetical protein n=1 Tax=Microbacterium paraoxydans TaxID=199592 RepID=UPI003D71FD17